MKEKEIVSIRSYLDLINSTDALLFRGVEDKDYELIPSIARQWEGKLADLVGVEEKMLKELMLKAIPFIDYHPQNKLEWLMLAQHHGMQTRLLDWTTNPLVALYFASLGDENTEGAIFLSSSLPEMEPLLMNKPFQIEKFIF